jgi:N-methylhydantoinase B/oxoprolinase/acetone carboxylase alpha subunit
VIDRIGGGSFAYTMDDGSPLRVAITIDHQARTATVDFSGTGRQRDDNFIGGFARILHRDRGETAERGCRH